MASVSPLFEALVAFGTPGDVQRLRTLGERCAFFIERKWRLRKSAEQFVETRGAGDACGPIEALGVDGVLATIDALDHLSLGAVCTPDHLHDLAMHFVADPKLVTLYLWIWALKARNRAVGRALVFDCSLPACADAFAWVVAPRPPAVLDAYVKYVARRTSYVTVEPDELDRMTQAEIMLFLACAFQFYQACVDLVSEPWARARIRMSMVDVACQSVSRAVTKLVEKVAPQSARLTREAQLFVRAFLPPRAHCSNKPMRLAVTDLDQMSALVDLLLGTRGEHHATPHARTAALKMLAPEKE